MSLQHIALDQVTEADLQRLIADGVRENRVIDYKSQWHLGSDEEKREFLGDVCSFANASGGDLVFGIAEKDGSPASIIGLPCFAPDQEELRAQQLLRDGVAPRLPPVAFQAVATANGSVLIVRISKSWLGPHMVTLKGSSRFYSRHSNGRQPLDVHQIRAAFLASEHAGNRLRDFRLERVARISAGDGSPKLSSPSCAVWHIMPLVELPGLDRQAVIGLQQSGPLRPMGIGSGWSYQDNFDGMRVTITGYKDDSPGYVQVFRNGCIESVLAIIARNNCISPSYEVNMRDGLDRILSALPKLGIAPPYFVALSLLNVGGFKMAPPNDLNHLYPDSALIDRPHLLLPEIAVEIDPPSLDALTRPPFDRIWNACGYEGSPLFDDKGWKPGRRK